MSGTDLDLDPLQRRIGYAFRDPRLLVEAVTHSSWANEQGEGGTYERLEFLGDAVLALLTAAWLYEDDPAATEGTLSRRKGFAVSAPVLAAHAERLGLGEALRLGVGEERSGGRTKPSLLADVFEAVLGAVYLDGGLASARGLVEDLMAAAQRQRSRLASADPKSRLQELIQARGTDPPRYELVGEEGPDHDKRFTVECRLDGELVGVGSGRSKKVAEQRAATAALEREGAGGG